MSTIAAVQASMGYKRARERAGCHDCAYVEPCDDVRFGCLHCRYGGFYTSPMAVCDRYQCDDDAPRATEPTQ